MANLPLFQSENQPLMLLQTRWKSLLDPLVNNALLNGQLLSNVSLGVGNNTINHKLGRMMQGWFIVDRTDGTTIYRNGQLNSSTITLNASGPTTISLWVF